MESAYALSIWKIIETKLSEIETKIKKAEEKLEQHEKRIIKLEGPRKYYKVDSQGKFVP